MKTRFTGQHVKVIWFQTETTIHIFLLIKSLFLVFFFKLKIS